jgi:hypothetical protein
MSLPWTDIDESPFIVDICGVTKVNGTFKKMSRNLSRFFEQELQMVNTPKRIIKNVTKEVMTLLSFFNKN